MLEERNARRLALNPEEAARLTAGTREHGMGAAALRETRRKADAMAKLRVSGSQTGPSPASSGVKAASAPADDPLRTTTTTPRRRAALYHVLRS